ncbi:MAG: class I SAM-dependent methyltransferase [Rhodobacterales bacterium]|nr:class I SAM-dependent methyltransferase [Rhodobacterales bacterium]
MGHTYTNQFFDYIETGARSSARRMIELVQPWLGVRSVIDLGSGRGVWLNEWSQSGVEDVIGVDGDYVDRARLAIPAERFIAADLTRPQDFGRKFDLAQCLEVGEHLPETASKALVQSLTTHSDRILFSAAVPGQGGEFHVNEKPLSFWQDLFASHGYTAFDCVRPHLKDKADVENWYKYNSVLYVNDAGRKGLPQEVLDTEIRKGGAVQINGNAAWRLRLLVVKPMPRAMVTWIAQVQAAFLARRFARLQG